MRKVLVTGGARRIGRAIVERLASEGWAIAIHYNRSADDAEKLTDTVQKAGGNAVALKADLTDDAATEQLVADAAQALGGLTAVINNASLFAGDATAGADGRAVWDQHMAVHVRAPFVLAHALADGLADGGTGAVVNIADQRVLNPSRHFTSYTISKMALWDQTQVLARALAPHVRVNAVGPGPVLPSTRQSADDFEIQARQTPLGRPVDPSEIAAAVAFLLDAPSVTGQLIAVDAGQHLNWAYETAETAPKE